MRISVRLNKEYDKDLIKELESYKKKGNLSKLIREFIRVGLSNMRKDLSNNKNTIIKWRGFPH